MVGHGLRDGFDRFEPSVLNGVSEELRVVPHIGREVRCVWFVVFEGVVAVGRYSDDPAEIVFLELLEAKPMEPNS